MSTRDYQRKFDRNSNIKNSEYDRLNTNATRQSNPVMRGNNLLPTDTQRMRTSDNLLVTVIAVILGVLFFLFVVPLARFILPPTIYEGITFLAFSLVLTVGLVYFLRFLLTAATLKLKH